MSKWRGKNWETFCGEICLLSTFLSQVFWIAIGLSFKMRYWGGLCDFRKNYRSCFCGYPCPNSIVNAKCKDSYFSFEWSKWVGKKILRKNLCWWSTFVFCSILNSHFLNISFFCWNFQHFHQNCHLIFMLLKAWICWNILHFRCRYWIITIWNLKDIY